MFNKKLLTYLIITGELSVTELAKKIGISKRKMIYKITGKEEFSYTELDCLSKIYGEAVIYYIFFGGCRF